MAIMTLDVLMDNTPIVYRTYNDAIGYRLVSVSTDEKKYVHEWKFLVGDYTCKLQFKVAQGKGQVVRDGKTVYSLSNTSVAVSCSCKAYFFYNFPYNKKAGCDCSPPRLKPYKKTTDRPEFNILRLPSLCKHLFYLVNELYVDRILAESINKRLNSIYLAG